MQHGGVFVAHVEVDALGLHGVGGDQRALQRAVRVALEEPAVLEGAGLALVAVDRHQPRAGVAAHDAPLAPGGETRAAEAAQPTVAERLDHVVGGDRA